MECGGEGSSGSRGVRNGVQWGGRSSRRAELVQYEHYPRLAGTVLHSLHGFRLRRDLRALSRRCGCRIASFSMIIEVKSTLSRPSKITQVAPVVSPTFAR